MGDILGASVPDQALAVPVEPASGLAPPGFDPSRMEGKPRWLAKEHKAAFAPFWAALIGRLETATTDSELATLIEACRSVSQINCAWYEYELAKLLYEPAQAIEVQRAETGTGSVHESAVPQGCAQGQSHD